MTYDAWKLADPHEGLHLCDVCGDEIGHGLATCEECEAQRRYDAACADDYQRADEWFPTIEDVRAAEEVL